MILGALRTLLLEQSAIEAIVETRVRTYAIDKNEVLPAIDLRTAASGNTGQSLEGDKPGFMSYVTIDCYSDNGSAVADQLAKLLYSKALLGFRGTRDGVFIHNIVAPGAPEQDTETVDPASTKRRHVATVDYEVTWSLV